MLGDFDAVVETVKPLVRIDDYPQGQWLRDRLIAVALLTKPALPIAVGHLQQPGHQRPLWRRLVDRRHDAEQRRLSPYCSWRCWRTMLGSFPFFRKSRPDDAEIPGLP